MAKAPATIMYASLVSRETVRIALMTAALNDLEVKSGNILIAYVQAPVTEKVWTALGREFGKDAKKTAVIVRALFGQEESVSYLAKSQQEQLLGAILLSTWNPWGISLLRLPRL